MKETKDLLEISNLSISINNQLILSDVNFQAQTGDVIALVGPNGAGKSTLLKTLLKHFACKITKGDIIFNHKSIKNLETDQIAKLGFFLSFQNPYELNGVPMVEFLRNICQNNPNNNFASSFNAINQNLKTLNLDASVLKRNVNVNFSGGQKKKNEILQMLLSHPKIVLLDEIDSGLDIDAIKTIGSIINKQASQVITILVSHNLDFLKVVVPNKVVVLGNNKMVASGDQKLLVEIASKGYQAIIGK